MAPSKATAAGSPHIGEELSRLADTAADDSSAEAHPQICLLGADYLNSNLGIRALVTGAMTAIFAQYPRAEVKILEYGTASQQFTFELPQGRVSAGMLNMRFSKRPWVQNHIARLIATSVVLSVLPFFLRAKLLARNPWLRELSQTELVLALSGGDSFSDIYGLQRFVYMCLPQILVLLQHKKLVQLPQTIGPFRRWIPLKIARWILSRSTMVYTRDKEAVPQIRSLIPEKEPGCVRFCPDLGFIVPARVPAKTDLQIEFAFSRRPVVGLNVSGLLYMGGYTRRNMFGLASDYKSLINAAIKHFIEVKDATVLLVPHVATHQGEGDASACDSLMSELHSSYPDRLFSLSPVYDECEVKSFIAKCDFFAGARMHSCIAALSQSIPTAAMAYGDKFIGVFRSAGVENAVVDLRVRSADEVISLLSSLYDSRALLRSSLESKMPLIKNMVLGLLQPDPPSSMTCAPALPRH